jgi:hypothetical protein
MTKSFAFPDSRTATHADCFEFIRSLLLRVGLNLPPAQIPEAEDGTDIFIPDVLTVPRSPPDDLKREEGYVFDVLTALFPGIPEIQLRHFVFFRDRVEQREVTDAAEKTSITLQSWNNGMRALCLRIIHILGSSLIHSYGCGSRLLEEIRLMKEDEVQNKTAVLPALPNPRTAQGSDIADFTLLLRAGLGLKTFEAIFGYLLFYETDKFDDIGIIARLEADGHHSQEYVSSINVTITDKGIKSHVFFIFFRNGTAEVRPMDSKNKEVLKTFSTWGEAYRVLLDVTRDYLDQLKQAIPNEIPVLD